MKEREEAELALIEALLAEAAERCGANERLWAHFLRGLPTPVMRGLVELWDWQAHGGQRAPDDHSTSSGQAWTVWLLMAGRGFGKTRAGAEWISARARENPEARIALVGGSRDDVVKVMIEGPSGLVRVAQPRPLWKPSRNLLRFDNGAEAFVYTAEAPEALRGPEHHFAWADELAKWPARGADRCWDNLMMGLRLGNRPRSVVTTTPRPVPLLNRVIALAGGAVTRGRTSDNVHLPDAFVEWVRETYGGTRLGRQELDGELIGEIEGALFTRELLEGARCPAPSGTSGEGEYSRVVVGVDPPASAGGTCGIVVCAAGADSRLYVLADASAGGVSPDGWARAVAGAAESWGADRVIAEKNQGGDMVGAVLTNVAPGLPVKLVTASRGKVARAEPIAALFESGRAKLAGRFPELEDELAGLMMGGGYAGPGRSPDRADACVWALTALMPRPREPGFRFL
jgi:phage terminase large subunit-like protein